MGVSVQQICIANHYLMTNSIWLSIILKHFKAYTVVATSKLRCLGLNLGVAHEHRSCNANEKKKKKKKRKKEKKMKKYRLLNEQNRYFSSILVMVRICYVCITNFYSSCRIYSTFELLQYFKVRIPGLFLTMYLIFG